VAREEDATTEEEGLRLRQRKRMHVAGEEEDTEQKGIRMSERLKGRAMRWVCGRSV